MSLMFKKRRNTLKSFDTPIKRRVRKLYRRFLRSTILRHKNPRDVKVLCLPGYEAIEIFDVYDRLGIPRKNIWGVEYDDNVYSLLEQRRLGINLHLGLVQHFLYTKAREQDRKFDVINLDFCGHMKSSVISSLYFAFGARLLNDRGVLAVTFCASRENEEVKILLKRPFFLAKVIVSSSFVDFDDYIEKTQDIMAPKGDYVFYDEIPEIKIKVWKLIKEGKEKELNVISGKLDENVLRDGIDANIIDLASELYYYKLMYYKYSALALNELHKNGQSEEYKKLVDLCRDADKELESHKEGLVDNDVSMIPNLIERYSYHSGRVPMKTSFYQFRKAKELFKHSRPEFITWYLGKALVSYDMLPTVHQIEQPIGPKPSKQEVVEAIKRGLI